MKEVKPDELAALINIRVCANATVDFPDIHIIYCEDGQDQPLVITHIGGVHYKVLYGHEDFSWIEEANVLLEKLSYKCDSSGLDRFTADEYLAWGERWGWN